MNTQSYRGIFRTVLALLLFSASAIGAVAQQADSPWTALGTEFAGGGEEGSSTIEGDTYVLPSSGVEVTIGAGVESDNPAAGEVEDQIIVNAPDGLGAVAIIPSVNSPARTLEAYMGGFAESMDSVEDLDVNATRDHATAVYRVETGASVSYLVISVDAETLSGYHIIEVVVGDSAGLEDLIAAVNTNVAIDGVPMFDALDVDTVLEIVAQDDVN